MSKGLPDGDDARGDWRVREARCGQRGDEGPDGAVKEGLLALAVGACSQVMHVLMQESVTALAGPKEGRARPGLHRARHDGARNLLQSAPLSRAGTDKSVRDQQGRR